MIQPISLLCLGDSYTIGEGLPVFENFPYQLAYLMRRHGIPVFAPEIVAKTGWTTSELMVGIDQNPLLPSYDVVTLLIGVNDQYRGQTIESFGANFSYLIQKAKSLCTHPAKGLVVLSIPDWGKTPFAKGRDLLKIYTEIDQFNQLKKAITEQHSIPFIDITTALRINSNHADMLTNDELHYSGKVYAEWANKVNHHLQSTLFYANSNK